MHRINKIVWIFILLAFSTILGILLFGGSVTLYLSPRMVNMVYFGLAVLSALFVYNIFSVFAKEHEKKHNVFRLKNLLFIIPVVLFIFTSPDQNTVSALPAKNLNLTYANEIGGIKEKDQENVLEVEETRNETPQISPTHQSGPALSSDAPYDNEGKEKNENGEAAQTENQAKDTEEDSYEIADVAGMPACVINNNVDVSGTVSSVEEKFSEYMYKSLGELIGQEAALYGFVYKDDSFPEGTIAVSRLLISCCAADASLVGYHVKVEDPDEYEDDEWILVSGVVMAGSMEYYGQYYEIPIITGGMVTKCKSPQTNQAYIYP